MNGHIVPIGGIFNGGRGGEGGGGGGGGRGGGGRGGRGREGCLLWQRKAAAESFSEFVSLDI